MMSASNERVLYNQIIHAYVDFMKNTTEIDCIRLCPFCRLNVKWGAAPCVTSDKDADEKYRDVYHVSFIRITKEAMANALVTALSLDLDNPKLDKFERFVSLVEQL